MLDRIKVHPELKDLIEETCCENEVCVEIDDSLRKEDYIILKVDKYYNGLNLEKTPASPDCLIVQRCEHQGFSITIVELKSIYSSRAFTVDNLSEKFRTCLEDFMSKRFKAIFKKEYIRIELYFVSHVELYKRDLSLKMEALMNEKFNFEGRRLSIIPKMPVPVIRKCY